MNYKIDFDTVNNVYNVTESGIIIESFDNLYDALDYRAAMIWERDIAFQDYGTEWDIEMV
jgi:hypothetical protein